jgi:hypothetical protein
VRDVNEDVGICPRDERNGYGLGRLDFGGASKICKDVDTMRIMLKVRQDRARTRILGKCYVEGLQGWDRRSGGQSSGERGRGQVQRYSAGGASGTNTSRGLGLIES